MSYVKDSVSFSKAPRIRVFVHQLPRAGNPFRKGGGGSAAPSVLKGAITSTNLLE